MELPKEIREEIPPQDDLWKNAPGELIWFFNADPDDEASGRCGFSWQVRKLVPSVHFNEPAGPLPPKTYYEASTPYRAVYYQGDTPGAAVAALLKGLAILSREGAINPNAPHMVGAPPIQHAIHILTERLLLMVERRRDHLVMSGYAENPESVAATQLTADHLKGPPEDELLDQMVRAVARDNEVVSALATAIAALARVKDL